jgi:adenylate cyclase
MAEIIAQGAEATSQSRRTLRKHETFRLGRDPAGWCISWEPWLSRHHVELTWDGDSLKATTLPDAKNPVFFRGEPAGNFAMRRGECFVVGATTFRLNADEASSPTPTPLVDNAAILHSFTVSAEELRQVPFRDAPRRLDVLTHLTKLIFGAVNDEELHAQATELLLEGVRGADAVAWVAIDETACKTELRVLHGDRRRLLDEDFRPSRRLVQEAVLHKHDSVVHVWTEAEAESMQQFTMQGNFDWAFCTPLRSEVCKGQGLYVTGRSTESEPSALLAPWRTNELSEDVKFTELVADILGAMLQTQMLQHRQSVLSHFFSPNVLQLLATTDPETALHPRETQVTSLFCDLRGFSQKVENAARNLPEILERVSAALGVMSTAILRQKGVVADFLGDCAMGFWGWPIPQPDDALRACAAALDIRKAFEEFSRIPGHPLADFRVGVGIATGQAVAGQIGSRDQVKVTAFGPSVNLASRLEGLTKKLRVPVLLDEETTRMVVASMPADAGRCRRLARVRPFGLQAPLTVSELLPPADVDPTHTTEHIALYESALDAFLAGRWSEAYELLHQIPAQDLGKDFLVSYILQHNHSPPQGWDGVIAIEAK